MPSGVPASGVEMLFHPGTEADARMLIQPSGLQHVDVIPSAPGLAAYDLADQQHWESADLHLALVDALTAVHSEYAYVFCDCPPRLSLVAFAALVASNYVIIPLEAADWGAQGVTQVTEAVNYVRGRENRHLTLLGYLVSRFKTARSYQHSYLKQLREHFGPLAFDTVIPDLAGFEKSVTHAHPVNLRRPSSREARVAGQLFDEVERRIEADQRRGTRSRQSNVSASGLLAV